MDELRHRTFISLRPWLRREEFKAWMNSQTGHMSLGPRLRREEFKARTNSDTGQIMSLGPCFGERNLRHGLTQKLDILCL